MSWDLGDVVPLSITITNAAGQAEDATAVHLAVTLPDGTAQTYGPLSSTSPGVYDYDYAPVQAGRHVVRWVATGSNASAYVDVFDVTPSDGGDFISLADVKNHLALTSTSDDEKLRGFIAAACQAITDRMGPVSPVTVTHEVTSSGCTVVLPRRPVIEIISVQTLPDLTAVPQADRAAGVDGWILDSPEGVVTLTRWYRELRFTYRLGRSPLPPKYRLAGLELTAHLWRTSQLNSGGGRPSVGVDEVIVPGTTYALPYNVRQLLGLDKRPQDEVLVG